MNDEFYVPRDENNRALWYDTDYVSNQIGSKFDVRNIINGKGCVPDWCKPLHKDLRSEAAMTCYEMFESAITNRKQRNHLQLDPDQPVIGFLTKKRSKYRFCFPVPGSCVHVQNDARYITIFPGKTNNYKIRLSKHIPQSYLKQDKNKYVLSSEAKIHFNGHAFYLCISKPVEKYTPENRKSLIALDPGIRKIAVGFDGTSHQIYGQSVYKKIYKLLKRRDEYQSVGDKGGYFRMESRINGIIKNEHHQITNKITKNYNQVILPKLNSKQLVYRSTNKYLNRAIYRSKICSFYETLKTKMSDRNGVFYGREQGVHEKYSSKLCSYCKYIDSQKNKLETKTCPKCFKVTDRDMNASRNIYYMNRYLAT